MSNSEIKLRGQLEVGLIATFHWRIGLKLGKWKKSPPVCVDMALTRACGAMCSFCYAMVQEPQERSSIKTKEALNLLDDFSEIGVKAVSLISDGESTLSKAYVPFIQHASKIGIDVGNATNGWEVRTRKN